jgi:predicted alpha/beta-fold hydrolase
VLSPSGSGVIIGLLSDLRNKHLFENDKRFDWSKVMQSLNFRDLEETFIMRQFGYEKLDDYHRDCSIGSKLDCIRVPTLLFGAADDMFSPKRGYFFKTVLNKQ